MFKKIGVQLGLHSIRIVNQINNKINMAEEYIISYTSKKDYISEVKRAINDFSDKTGEKWLAINFSIKEESIFEENSVFIGEFKIPEINKKQVKRAVLNELQGQTDIDLKRYNTVIKSDLINNMYVGVGYGLDKAIIEDLENIGKINWKIERIEILGESLSKLVNKREITAIVDMDIDSVSIFYVELGQLKEVRKVKISNILEIDDDIEFKEDMIERCEINNDILMGIKDEIRTIENKHKLELDQIYISGGFAVKPGVGKLLEEEILINVRKIYKHEEPLEDEKSNDLVYIPQESSYINDTDETTEGVGNFPIFAGALGVVLSTSELNFGHQRKLSINVESILLSLCTGLLILNIGSYAVNTKYNTLINDVIRDSEVVQSYQTDISSEISSLQTEIESDTNKISDINKIIDRKIYLSDILFTLSKESPKDIKIENIRTKEGFSMIKGYSKNYKDIAYLAMSLEKYGEVEIEKINKAKSKIKNSEDSKELEQEFRITLKHGKGRLNRE